MLAAHKPSQMLPKARLQKGEPPIQQDGAHPENHSSLTHCKILMETFMGGPSLRPSLALPPSKVWVVQNPSYSAGPTWREALGSFLTPLCSRSKDIPSPEFIDWPLN